MTPAPARLVFDQATAFFVGTVEAVRPEQWGAPGLDRWSVRDLVGHTSRALIAVETYLERPAEAIAVASPVDYFVTVLRSDGGAPANVARRGREAGAALGPDPITATQQLAARVLERVSAADDEQLLTTPVGGMRLRDYLPTRTFELVVHTLDLAAAIGLPVEPPPEAAAASLELAAHLAIRSGQGVTALLALTGRHPLPPGFSVV